MYSNSLQVELCSLEPESTSRLVAAESRDNFIFEKNFLVLKNSNVYLELSIDGRRFKHFISLQKRLVIRCSTINIVNVDTLDEITSSHLSCVWVGFFVDASEPWVLKCSKNVHQWCKAASRENLSHPRNKNLLLYEAKIINVFSNSLWNNVR